MQTTKKSNYFCILFAVFFALIFFSNLFFPKKSFSESERRTLTAFPAFHTSAVSSGRFMSSFETYAKDHFPFRDSFRKTKFQTVTKLFHRFDDRGIYISNGYASKLEYPLNDASIQRACDRFQFLYQNLLTKENRIFFSIIPDKNYFLAAQSGRLSMDYQRLEKEMVTRMDFAKYIPIFDFLELEDYYRTDTHWRQEQLLDVAEHLSVSMGVNWNDSYQEQLLDRDFYGTYFTQTALPLEPDSLRYFTNETLSDCTMYDHQNNCNGSIYDFSRASGRDPYELFLGGPLSYITLQNPQAATDRKLILFRDSFASSIAPLLLSGYSQITLIDIRYLHPDYLKKMVDFTDCDILFLYSTLVLNHSDTFR